MTSAPITESSHLFVSVGQRSTSSYENVMETMEAPQSTDVQTAKTLFHKKVKTEDLLALPPESSPYEFSELLKNERFSERRLAKKKIQQLRMLDPIIRAMLLPEERVIYLTDGIKQKSLEQLFIGWIMYYYNHNAFVFTSERILMIHLNGKKKLGTFVGVIDYEDLIRVKNSIFGSLSIKFRNKKSLVFSRVARKDRSFIKGFLNPLIEENATRIDKQAPMILDLCPACYQTVSNPLLGNCPHCDCAYRTPKEAALRSLLLPGLGDLYLGSKLGYLEMLFMLYLWASFCIGNIELVRQGFDPLETWMGTLIVLGVIHIIDAVKTHYVAKKGIFPKESIEQIRAKQIA